MANEITLPVGATAEPDTCGSCKFFRRKPDDYNASRGTCGFRFPPKFDFWFAKVTVNDFQGTELDIADTDRCDLYRFSGKVYIVQRRIPPLREG